MRKTLGGLLSVIGYLISKSLHDVANKLFITSAPTWFSKWYVLVAMILVAAVLQFFLDLNDETPPEGRKWYSRITYKLGWELKIYLLAITTGIGCFWIVMNGNTQVFILVTFGSAVSVTWLLAILRLRATVRRTAIHDRPAYHRRLAT